MNASALRRIKLKTSLAQLLEKVERLYSLGRVHNYRIFGKGVIEVNIKITIHRGEFVLKIFSEKKYWRVKQLTNFLSYIEEKGVKVQKIISTKSNKLYFRIKGVRRNYYACLLSYFSGQDFSKTDPSLELIKEIAKSLAQINKTRIKIALHYDDCLVSNLSREFKKNEFLIKNNKYKNMVRKYAHEIRNINFDKLQDGIIHGDLSREHVLVKDREICLLDFGALNFGKIVVDLAVAMSWFCLDVNNFSRESFWQKYSLFLETYKKYIKLSDYEIKVLPILICANYAMNYLLGKYYLEVIGEPHAKYYSDFGKRGIDLVDPLIEQSLSHN